MQLISNLTIPDSDVSFDPATYHFTQISTGKDITNDIRRIDKIRLVPDFDIERENFRLSDELGNGADTGHTLGLDPLQDNTAAIFAEQIITDPLAAPLESANNLAKKLLNSPAVLLTAGVVILALLFRKE